MPKPDWLGPGLNLPVCIRCRRARTDVEKFQEISFGSDGGTMMTVRIGYMPQSWTVPEQGFPEGRGPAPLCSECFEDLNQLRRKVTDV